MASRKMGRTLTMLLGLGHNMSRGKFFLYMHSLHPQP
ncbi:hypothetical protein Patl1_31426 [Pistacia atlantica]|uniref:Uncharacterized protein n=1 Tax=Pistacia atlantica TaxID=434234 RepID=A0ACC1AQ68_9ROSI|nr:hypothetical protein Patl1_31426 [Pistacia atlantica]